MPDDAIIDEDQNQITYNVVIDPGDIARQAEEIRNQLDLALGVGSSAGTQFVSTTDFINPQFAPLPKPDFNQVGQFGGTIDQTFWQKAQARMEKVSQDISTGYDRIRQDLSMVAERGGNIIQRFQPEPQSINPFENLLPDTFGEYLVGSLGFGGDITGPVAPSEYQRYSNVKLGEELSDFGKGNFGAIAGAIIGTMVAPGPGTIEGAMIGSTVDDAVELVTGTYNKRNDLAEGLQEIARQQYGSISKEEALGVANQIVDFTFSEAGTGKGYDLEEISQNILQFANEGGFNNVKNTEQFKEKIQAITEDLRQFGRDMGVFQEEAISILAEMEQRGIAKVENMREISSNMKFYSGVTGMAPTELLQGAMQTAEQFRQTLSPETAMQMYVDAEVEATRLVRSTNPEAQSLVYRLGGPQGVAQSLIGSYNSLYQGPWGQIRQMNQYYGGNPYGGLNDKINTSAENWTPQNFLDMLGDGGRKPLDKNASMQEIALAYGTDALKLIEQLGLQNPDGSLTTASQLKGAMRLFKETIGLNDNEVDAIVETLRQSATDLQSGDQFKKITESSKLFSQLQSARQNTETTVWGDIKNNFGRVHAFGKTGGFTIRDLEMGFNKAGNWVGGALEDAWDWTINRGFGFGWFRDIDWEKGEINTGWLRSSTGAFEFTKDMLPNDAGIIKQFMLGEKSEYRTAQKSWMENKLKEKGYDENKIKRIVGGYFGDTSVLMSADENYAYAMLKGGPDISDMLDAKDYYNTEVAKIISENPKILVNEKGENRTTLALVEELQTKIGDDFAALSPELKAKLTFNALRVNKDKKVQEIIVDDKKLENTEKRMKKEGIEGRSLGREFNATYSETLKQGTKNAEDRLQKNLAASLYTNNPLSSIGTAIDIIGASQKVLQDIDELEMDDVETGKYKEEYYKRLKVELKERKGKDLTRSEIDNIDKLLSSKGPIGLSLGLYGKNKDAEEYAPAYKVIDEVMRLNALNLKEGKQGIEAELIGVAGQMLAERNIATGQGGITEKITSEQTTELAKLLSLAKGKETDMSAFIEQMNTFAKSVDWSTSQVNQFVKENTNYVVDDNAELGTTAKLQLKEQEKQTGLLSKIAGEPIPKTTTKPIQITINSRIDPYPKVIGRLGLI